MLKQMLKLFTRTLTRAYPKVNIFSGETGEANTKHGKFLYESSFPKHKLQWKKAI